MSAAWKHIADELQAIADDRALAASNEPDPAEARLLQRESALLARTAVMVQAGTAPASLASAASDAVVVSSDDLLVWGLSHEGEGALRRLADDPHVDVHQIDPALVLAALLGTQQSGPYA
jgi:hypothetical protein